MENIILPLDLIFRPINCKSEYYETIWYFLDKKTQITFLKTCKLIITILKSNTFFRI